MRAKLVFFSMLFTVWKYSVKFVRILLLLIINLNDYVHRMDFNIFVIQGYYFQKNKLTQVLSLQLFAGDTQKRFKSSSRKYGKQVLSLRRFFLRPYPLKQVTTRVS